MGDDLFASSSDEAPAASEPSSKPTRSPARAPSSTAVVARARALARSRRGITPQEAYNLLEEEFGDADIAEYEHAVKRAVRMAALQFGSSPARPAPSNVGAAAGGHGAKKTSGGGGGAGAGAGGGAALVPSDSDDDAPLLGHALAASQTRGTKKPPARASQPAALASASKRRRAASPGKVPAKPPDLPGPEQSSFDDESSVGVAATPVSTASCPTRQARSRAAKGSVSAKKVVDSGESSGREWEATSDDSGGSDEDEWEPSAKRGRKGRETKAATKKPRVSGVSARPSPSKRAKKARVPASQENAETNGETGSDLDGTQPASVQVTGAGRQPQVKEGAGGDSMRAGDLELMMPRTSKSGATLLVQVDDDSLDLTGDSGAIGRVHVNKQEIVLDIKGHRYAGHLVPCNTFMVVGTSGAKRQAKIESLMGDYVHLSHMRDVVATLEGKFTGDRDASLFHSNFDDVDERQQDTAAIAGDALPRTNSKGGRGGGKRKPKGKARSKK